MSKQTTNHNVLFSGPYMLGDLDVYLPKPTSLKNAINQINMTFQATGNHFVETGYIVSLCSDNMRLHKYLTYRPEIVSAYLEK